MALQSARLVLFLIKPLDQCSCGQLCSVYKAALSQLLGSGVEEQQREGTEPRLERGSGQARQRVAPVCVYVCVLAGASVHNLP